MCEVYVCGAPSDGEPCDEGSKHRGRGIRGLMRLIAYIGMGRAKFMDSADNLERTARQVMREIDPELENKYANIIRFLEQYPDAASAIRGRSAPIFGSREYIEKQAMAFAKSREKRAPASPQTIPDELVSLILVSYFGISEKDIERIKHEHQLSMGAENMVGELLERYLASIMEPKGWVWCSGSLVKAVDFLKPPVSTSGTWALLQVKNRSNSENSSSSAIRVGTGIEKWHRTFSTKEGSNWEAFPDILIRPDLSEVNFKIFVRKYLRTLR